MDDSERYKIFKYAGIGLLVNSTLLFLYANITNNPLFGAFGILSVFTGAMIACVSAELERYHGNKT